MSYLVSRVVNIFYTFFVNNVFSSCWDIPRRFYNERFYFKAIRIAKGCGVPATQHIMQNAYKLTKLASYGKYGRYILGGVVLAAGCVQIANEDNQQKKNEIFVETVTSTTVGVVGGALVGLFLVSNPVGWGTAFVLATGTAADRKSVV